MLHQATASIILSHFQSIHMSMILFSAPLLHFFIFTGFKTIYIYINACYIFVRESDYGNEDVAESVKEEKKRKQMEAIADDLFNNEKVLTRYFNCSKFS